MEVRYDPAKNQANMARHGISFERVAECDWTAAQIRQDDRYDYGEARFIAYVPLEERLYNIVFTLRDDTMRVISFRKANARERKRYEK